MPRLVLAVLFLLMNGSASLANIGKEFRDWYVFCDTELKCNMQAQITSPVAYNFGIEREGKANAPISFFVALSDGYLAGSDVVVTIDRDRNNRYVFSGQTAIKKEGILTFSPLQNGQGFVDAMMSGSSMELLLQSTQGPISIRVSLSGVTASTLFMDETQQRIGNRDALQAKGSGEPRNAFTRARSLNSSSDLPIAVRSFWESNRQECAQTFDNSDLIKSFGGISVTDEFDAVMYILPCGGPGAYNVVNIALMHDSKEGHVRQIVFPTMGPSGPTVIDLPYNLNWNDADSILSSFYKGRGLGDCGVRSKWKWPGGGYGANFELIEETIKDDCDGNYDNWSQIWPPQ